MKALSGIMHCWLLAKAEVGGETHICLRGVNFTGGYEHGIWQGEFDKQHPESPAAHNQPWWHVPTVKFEFDSRRPAGEFTTLRRVWSAVESEWPALRNSQPVNVMQDLYGEIDGRDSADRIEAVTRIVLDLGIREELPTVIFKPGAQLDWPRHPVIWVKAKKVEKTPEPLAHSFTVHPFNRASNYMLAGPQPVTMEVDNKGASRAVTVSNLVIQNSIAALFEETFGTTFFTLVPNRPGLDWKLQPDTLVS